MNTAGIERARVRREIILAELTKACMTGDHTPGRERVSVALVAAGVSCQARHYSEVVDGLVTEGSIEQIGALAKKLYRIPGTDFITKPAQQGRRASPKTPARRAAVEADRNEVAASAKREMDGWPIPTKATIAAYDRALATYGPKAFEDTHAKWAGDGRMIRTSRSHWRSATGCATAWIGDWA